MENKPDEQSSEPATKSDVAEVKHDVAEVRKDAGELKGLMKDMLEELNATHEDVRYVRNTVDMLVRSDAVREAAIESLRKHMERVERKSVLLSELWGYGKKRMIIEDLAAMTQCGFRDVEGRIASRLESLENKVDTGFKVMKGGFTRVLEEIKGLRHEVKRAGQAGRLEYAGLRARVGKLEAKVEAIERKK